MEILEGKALTRLLLERYSKNPSNWHFAVSPSGRSDGFFDALVSSPSESWHIKLDSIFKPSPIMLGTKVEVDDAKLRKFSSPVSYGYRSLSEDVLLKILSTFEEQRPRPTTTRKGAARATNSIEGILGGIEPVAPVSGGSYAEGPFIFTKEKVIGGLSSGQEQLDDKLSSELRRLLRNRYQSYG